MSRGGLGDSDGEAGQVGASKGRIPMVVRVQQGKIDEEKMDKTDGLTAGWGRFWKRSLSQQGVVGRVTDGFGNRSGWEDSEQTCGVCRTEPDADSGGE